jgi:hypothetical protein
MILNQGMRVIFVGLLIVFMILIAGCSSSDRSAPSDESQVAESSLNSADFSGVWEGTALIDSVKNSEEYNDLEGAIFFCEVVLELDQKGDGFADLYLDGELAGASLTAKVVQDRPHLVGEVFESPFEFYGTFSDESETWTLIGGGEIQDGEATFSLVFNLSAAAAAQDPSDPEAPMTEEPAVSVDASLEEFLVGSWMRDELFGEYKVKTFNSDGSTVFSMDKPGSGDDINNWPGGGWTIVQSATGEWAIVGDLLVAAVTPEHLSLETEVKIIDSNTIEIVELLTKTLYYRVP